MYCLVRAARGSLDLWCPLHCSTPHRTHPSLQPPPARSCADRAADRRPGRNNALLSAARRPSAPSSSPSQVPPSSQAPGPTGPRAHRPQRPGAAGSRAVRAFRVRDARVHCARGGAPKQVSTNKTRETPDACSSDITPNLTLAAPTLVALLSAVAHLAVQFLLICHRHRATAGPPLRQRRVSRAAIRLLPVPSRFACARHRHSVYANVPSDISAGQGCTGPSQTTRWPGPYWPRSNERRTIRSSGDAPIA